MGIRKKEKRDNGLYIVMLLFTLFMGAGTVLFQGDSPLRYPLGFVIFAALSFYMIKRLRGITMTSQLFCIICLFSFWTIYHWLRVGHYDLAFIMLILHIVAGYLMICLFKEKIIDYYEEIAYGLALFSLFMWIINNALGSDVMSAFAPFESSAYNLAHDRSGSFLFYVTGAWKQEQFFDLYRNQGYCWEAGRFASLSCLGLVCYIIKCNGILRLFDKHLWVYILTILSTFSTTGYITTFVIIGLCVLFGSSVGVFRRILLASVLFFAAYYFQDSDFMGEKVKNQMDVSSFKSQGADYYMEGGTITVERFEGLYLDWLNFLDEPIMGYGLTDKWSYMQRNINKELITSNGVAKPFAQYGVVLALGFFVYLFRGTKSLLSARGISNNRYILFITIVLISISYDFNKTPLIIALALYSIIYKNRKVLSYGK